MAEIRKSGSGLFRRIARAVVHVVLGFVVLCVTAAAGFQRAWITAQAMRAPALPVGCVR